MATYLERQGMVRQPHLVLVHSRHAVHHGAVSIDVEVGVVVPAPMSMTARVQLRQLPSALVASTVHIGNEQALHAAYVALLRWLDANGQQWVGPPRQVQLAAELDGDPHARMTEIQFPIPMSAAYGETCRRAGNV